MSIGSGMRCKRAAPRDLFALRIAQLMRHFSRDEAGRQRIHGDAELAHLARQRTREADQRGLGRAVYRQAAVAGRGDDRGDVDDPAFALRHHGPQDVLRQHDGRDGVEMDQPLNFLIAHVGQDAARAQSRIVDQAVQRRRNPRAACAQAAPAPQDRTGRRPEIRWSPGLPGPPSRRPPSARRSLAGDRDDTIALARQLPPWPVPVHGCRR